MKTKQVKEFLSSRTIFISHASEDKTLALMTKSLFESLNNDISVFCSSDIKDIEGGQLWFEKIMDALYNSKVCISLLTPNSIYRPWVIFESGGSYVLSKRDSDNFRMFPVCAYGLNATDFREKGPFAFIQARHLKNKNDILILCKEIGKIFGNSNFKPTNESIDLVCKESSRGSSQWGSVNQSLVGERMDSSPFSLDHLINEAHKHIFIAGQSLHHLSTHESVRIQLIDWLKEKNNRIVQILLCNPKEVAAVKAWDIISKEYPKDLSNSIDDLKNWLTVYRSKGIESELDIRVTKLVPTTINIIDPALSSAKMVLIPVVFSKPFGSERPHFVISKTENKIVFNHYWDTYQDTFNRATKIEDIH